jgi:anti-anti-sigma factor
VRNGDMRINAATMPPIAADEPTFTLGVLRRGARRIVTIGGEIDIESRDRVRLACSAARGKTVIVEMGDVTFMDCCGYGGLVAARLVMHASGGSLILSHAIGQPADLLAMLAVLEARN